MATFTNAVNYVLRRMREDEVATPTATAYAKLIGDFVNATKREVEDIHDWQNLRTDITVPMVEDQSEYAITGSGVRGRVLSVWHVQDLLYLHKGVPKNIKALLRDDPLANGNPSTYYMTGNNGTDRTMEVWTRPDATTQSLIVEVVVPQEEMSDGSEVFGTPHWPIYLGALARAIDERGDDGGNNLMKAEAAYHNAVADAVAHDITDIEGEMNWYED